MHFFLILKKKKNAAVYSGSYITSPAYKAVFIYRVVFVFTVTSHLEAQNVLATYTSTKAIDSAQAGGSGSCTAEALSLAWDSQVIWLLEYFLLTVNGQHRL